MLWWGVREELLAELPTRDANLLRRVLAAGKSSIVHIQCERIVSELGPSEQVTSICDCKCQAIAASGTVLVMTDSDRLIAGYRKGGYQSTSHSPNELDWARSPANNELHIKLKDSDECRVFRYMEPSVAPAMLARLVAAGVPNDELPEAGTTAPDLADGDYEDQPRGAGTTASTVGDIGTELEQLANLHKGGALTDEEFRLAKERLLG